MKNILIPLIFAVMLLFLGDCSENRESTFFQKETASLEKASDMQTSGDSQDQGAAESVQSQPQTVMEEETQSEQETAEGEEETMRKMRVQVGNQIFEAALEDNAAADAFVEMMKAGSVVIRMTDYSGFEKVGSLGTSLPSSDTQMTTQSGDIVLYNDSQIVMFYGSNSWSYTRIGKIEDLAGWEEALGAGEVTVTFSTDIND